MFWIICIATGLIILQFMRIPALLYLWVAIGLPIRFFIWLHRKVEYKKRFGKWLPDSEIDMLEYVEGELICRELNRHNVYYAKQFLGIKEDKKP